MTEHETKARKRRRRVSPGIAVTLGGYLCILALAVRTDGLVAAQAQQQQLADAALAVRAANQAAVQQDRAASLELSRRNAKVLADLQLSALPAASSGSSSEASSSASSTASSASSAPSASSAASSAGATSSASATSEAASSAPAVSATGTFQANAYAGGFAGKSKTEYWQSINNDVIGYLHIPGTNISHAVVQNTKDVNYYTKRGYYKEDSYYGVLWTNPNTKSAGTSRSLSSNTVIYGHNWTNYSATPRIGAADDIMFGQLTGYHYLSMAQSYPYLYYSTNQEDMVFKIFAVFYSEPSFLYNITENLVDANGKTVFTIQNVIDEARKRSRFKFDVEVDSSDKLITLSTCTRAYGATPNQRFVVMGRLLRPGESVKAVSVQNNPNHKQPDVWNK